MLVRDILKPSATTISFEFFPPKTAPDNDALLASIGELKRLQPAYVSVTYGAGGSTHDRTHHMVLRIQQETRLNVVSHLTCVGAGKEEIDTLLTSYAANGIENILALRGDLPRGETDWQRATKDFRHAADLVLFIKKRFPAMCIGVAGFPEGHPETPNRLQEIEHLKAKVDAGADYIVTQLFFDNRDYYDFVERCELAGIKVPVVAGILPVNNRAGMIRMAELAAGARIPAPLLKAVQRCADDGMVEQVGIHCAAEQVRDLIDHQAPGIHIYTLNQSRAALKLFGSLGLRSTAQLTPSSAG